MPYNVKYYSCLIIAYSVGKDIRNRLSLNWLTAKRMVNETISGLAFGSNIRHLKIKITRSWYDELLLMGSLANTSI